VRPAYPLLLDLSDRVIVIIGGGAVAARKAAGVIAAGAKQVTLVAPKLTAEMPAGISHLAKTYDARDLTAAELVFAATNEPDVNAQVVRDAHAAGIFANRADTDEAEPGDFIVPAVLRRGSLTITVSATAAPALAAKVRDEIAGSLDERWVTLSDATQSLRPRIIGAISDPARRRAALHDLASEEAASVASTGDAGALQRWLAGRFPEVKTS